MYEFGEEFIIESYKVPWLIWIQLLVMILLIFLLFFGFSVFSIDLSDNFTSSTSSAGGPSTSAGRSTGLLGSGGKGPLPITSSSRRRTDQGQDEIHRGVETSSSRGGEREGCSVKDTAGFSLFESPQHPCHYFGLAKEAFLKCLGLDFSSDRSNNRKRGKED